MEKKTASANGKVTQSMFNAIKILIESGEPQDEIGRLFGVSKTVVFYIGKSETLEEYKNNIYVTSSSYRNKMRAMNAKANAEKKPVAEMKETAPVMNPTMVTVQATHYMMEELKQMNEHLKMISNKVAFIVEELTK